MYQDVDHDAFDEKTFFPRFFEDLHTARGLVLIQGPFLSADRIEKMKDALREVMLRGVRVCEFVQQPKHWHSKDPILQDDLYDFRKNIRTLQNLGVHVTVRPGRHEKVLTIDDRILYDGSLNALSHTYTNERMTRFVNRGKVIAAIKKHKLYTCGTCTAARPITAFYDHDLSLTYIGQTIAKKRKQLGLSQRLLAEVLSIPQRTIWELESGKRNVELNTLLRVCSFLGLELLLVNWFVSPSLHHFSDRTMGSGEKRKA